MCRFAAYMGRPILLEDVIVKPSNALIKQSLHARESVIRTNGDGFGVGWYMPDLSEDPGLFTSVYPAWNDRNLLHLAAKIKSPCFFAHVRAASMGGVSPYNCHPFIHGRWMLMHNGNIQDFINVKRHLRHLLDDDIYNSIQGETDSEHLFALFLQYAKGKSLSNIESVYKLITTVFKKIEALINQYGTPGNSYFNVCITDGKRMVASRYSSDESYTPETLYYTMGSHFVREDGKYHINHQADYPINHVLISSEKLNGYRAEWEIIPPNHMLLVHADLQITLQELK